MIHFENIQPNASALRKKNVCYHDIDDETSWRDDFGFHLDDEIRRNTLLKANPMRPKVFHRPHVVTP